MGTQTTAASAGGAALRKWADLRGRELVFDTDADDSVLAMGAVDLAATIADVCDKYLFDVGEALEVIERLRLKASGAMDTDRVVMLGTIRDALTD